MLLPTEEKYFYIPNIPSLIFLINLMIASICFHTFRPSFSILLIVNSLFGGSRGLIDRESDKDPKFAGFESGRDCRWGE